MPLEYNVKREYTIPGLTFCFSVASIIAIVALAVLNVVLQGYDIVTVLRPNPNITESYWWSTRALSVRSAGDCSPVSLPRRSAIITNSSLFPYELRGVFGADSREISGSWPYMANPLRSCTVDGIAADFDLARRITQFNTRVFCAGAELPYALSLVSKFSINDGNPYSDDIINYYLQGRRSTELLDADRLLQRNASSLLNIVGVIDATSSDLVFALDVLNQASANNIPNLITAGGVLACPGGQNETCEPQNMRMTVPKCGVTYPNGTGAYWNGICSFLTPIEAEFLNVFTVLHDAYHIDFGNIEPSNTLLSKQEFSSRIHSSPFLSQFVRNHPDMGICGSALRCLKGSTWVDSLLASNTSINVVVPSVLAAGNTSAVAKVDYLCPEFKIKTPGSLITSVFIGTWSMYMALVGLFGVVGPMLEQRYGRAHSTSSPATPVPQYELKS